MSPRARVGLVVLLAAELVVVAVLVLVVTSW